MTFGLFVAIGLFFSACETAPTSTQESVAPTQTSSQDRIYDEPDKLPQPPDGFQSYAAWIGKNLKYPDNARKKGIEGKVHVEFVVSKEGRVTNAKVVQGIDAACDTESLRVINMSPDWTPGQVGGKNVNVRLVLPITFKLS